MHQYDVFRLTKKAGVWVADEWSIVSHYEQLSVNTRDFFSFLFYTINCCMSVEIMVEMRQRRRASGGCTLCRKIYESSCCDDSCTLKGEVLLKRRCSLNSSGLISIYLTNSRGYNVFVCVCLPKHGGKQSLFAFK